MSTIGANPTNSTLTACIVSNLVNTPSDLERVSRSLEHRLDLFGELLLLSTLAVLIGLVVEYWDPIHEFIEELGRPAAAFPWRRLKELVGGILITLGVAGELAFTYFAARIETALRINNAKIVGLLNNTAAEAEKKAAEATDRASQADLKRVELENRIADIFGPRRLTAEQSARITGKLAALRGVKIDVYALAVDNPYTLGDSSDSLNIASVVLRILSAAHIDAEGWLLESCNGGGASNVVVCVRPDKSASQLAVDRKIASQVIKAFRPEIGTSPEIGDSPPLFCTNFSDLDKSRPNKGQHDAAISITIGRKINPLLTREMLEPVDGQKKP
jgi:hypothetical protein